MAEQGERIGEDVRQEVIDILSKIIPLSHAQLGNTVDTVHRLGKRVDENKSRQIIIQFGMRMLRDQVWKMSRNAAICRERKTVFREDFCKVDREAHALLWPKVEEEESKSLPT